MDEANTLEYNFLARPVVAAVATAGVLVLGGGLSAGVANLARQSATGAVAVAASDYASGVFFGGNAGMLLSPAMTGAAWMATQRLMGNRDPMLNLFATGATIDIASQWMLNPVGRALGLV